MSNISDAKIACHGLIPALQKCDCKVIETILNSQVRNPTSDALSYVRGYWMASMPYMPKGALERGPMLRHNTINGWRCFNADDDNQDNNHASKD